VKILHIIYDDVKNPWCGGGGAVRAWEINRRLSSNHKITVLTGNYPVAKDEVSDNVTFHRVGLKKSYLASRISFTGMLPFVFRDYDYDLVVNDFSVFSPCFANRYTRKPVITVFHHYLGTHTLRKFPVVGILPFFFERVIIRSSRFFITVSDGTYRKIQPMLDKEVRVETIPNGVSRELFNVQSEEGEYILFLGRIDIYMKGLDVLFQAFQKQKPSTFKCRLCIAGSGKKKDVRRLKEEIHRLRLSDRVEYLGEVNDAEKMELLRKSLFVVMPSRFEGWGIVAVEAAAAGKAVLGTKIPGLSEAVQDGKTGILVPPENADKLAEGIELLAGDSEKRKSMGRAGKEWARQFDWDFLAARQEEFYKEAVKN